MRIVDFLEESYVDFPGKVSAVVFTPGCNFNCASCHAKNILGQKGKRTEQEFFDYLDSTKDWIEGVVISGGECTLEPDLEHFARKLKEKGFDVKIDTNGSNPEILLKLKEKKLVDYVAIDVKAPFSSYFIAIGRTFQGLKEKLEKSMKITAEFPSYEFRTTIVPLIRGKINSQGEKISFITPEEIENIAKWIVKVTGKNNHRYYLQRFVPRQKGLLDKRLEEFPETPDKLLEEMRQKVIKHLPQTKIR